MATIFFVFFSDNAIKDVTCRYATKFMSKTRKLRIDREWWAETLQPYETNQKKLEELEDTELRMNLMKVRSFVVVIVVAITSAM